MTTTDDNKRGVGCIRPLTWPLEAKNGPFEAFFGRFCLFLGGALGLPGRFHGYLAWLHPSHPSATQKNGLRLPDPNRLSQADLGQATAGGFSGSLGKGWM